MMDDDAPPFALPSLENGNGAERGFNHSTAMIQ